MYDGIVADLIDELGRLPGIGPKSAQRLAFHILQAEPVDVRRLAEVLVAVKERARFCSTCGHVTEDEECRICRDPRRDPHVICVVEEPQNVTVDEKTGGFRGVYHVLMGTISPLQGVGPDDLKIKGLLVRIGTDAVDEVILATNPTVEGEATAIYLARLHKPMGIRVTRIAIGIPVGSDIEFTDDLTMGKALEGRLDV